MVQANDGVFFMDLNDFKQYFENENIRHLTTLGHAPVAERQIRTIKDMIYKRIEHTKKEWWEVLYPVLLTYNKKWYTALRNTPQKKH